MDKISIAKFPLQTTVLLKKKFLHEIIEKIKRGKITYPNLYFNFDNKLKLRFSSFKDNLEPNYKNYRRLDIILYICKVFNIPITQLEKNVISYRTKKSRVIINNVKLPVEVSPVFKMLIGHLMGDGNYIRFKNKETIYSSYRQYNPILRQSFLDKVEYAFGDLNFPKDYFKKSTKIYLPEVISLVLLNYTNYTTDCFLSHNARIPTSFLDCADKETLIAILTSFIIDEGNIDSGQILIRLINKGLITDLAKICQILGYRYNIGKRSPGGMYNLYILNDGLKLYWNDYNNLKIKYPFLTMDYKEEAINKFIQRKKKFWKSSGMNSTKNAIIDLLYNESLSTKEIGYILNISRQGIKYHLDSLMERDIVKRIRARRGFKFELIKYIKFKESRKGRSKQCGYSNNKIINTLKNKVLSTEDISKLIRMDTNTTRNFLYGLEKENKIKRAGKTKVDLKHYKLLWSLR